MLISVRILLVALAVTTSLSAQMLIVQRVDLRAYPVITATLHAFDSTLTRRELNPVRDRLVFDNLTRQTLGVLHCTPPSAPAPISTTFLVDGTNQKHFRLYREGVAAWMNRSDTNSQVAIVEYGARPYLVRDLVANADSIDAAMTLLFQSSGTDLNRAFLDSLCGAFAIAERAAYTSFIVVISDGQSAINYDQVLSRATVQKSCIHVLSIGVRASDDLRRLSEVTGGVLFDNISDVQVSPSLTALAQISSSNGACTIEWTTDSTLCSRQRTVRFSALSISSSTLFSPLHTYEIPNNIHRQAAVSPSMINLGVVPEGEFRDTSITISAIGSQIVLDDVRSDNPQFQVLGAISGVTIPRGFSYSLRIRFSATDDYRRLARIVISSSACDSTEMYIVANTRENPALSPVLRSLRGGQQIYAGSLNTIAWSGVPPSDSVLVEYTINAGLVWNTIQTTATGLSLQWRAPDTTSANCYIRIALNAQGVFRYSESAFSIIRPQINVKSVQCGSQRLNEQKEVQTVSFVCNSTNTLLRIDSVVSFNPSFTAVSGFPQTLALSSCADLEVRFRPTTSGLQRDTLSVYTSAGLLRVPVSGTGKPAAAVVPVYINIGRIPIGVTFDTLVHNALCRATVPIVRVMSALHTVPDTTHFRLPPQTIASVLTPEDPCKSIRLQFFCTQINRFCSRVLMDTDSERYELVLFGEGICAPPEPHYGIGVPDSIMVAIGSVVNVPVRYFPAPYAYRSMLRPYTITVRFDKSILFPLAPTPLGVEQGSERVLTLQGLGFERGDTLITMRFRAAMGLVDYTIIRVEGFLWRDECSFNPPLASGRVFLTNVCRAGGLRQYVVSDSLTFRSVVPNPSNDVAHIEFSLRENGLTELELVDVFGRVQQRIFSTELQRGEYTSTIDVSSLCVGEYYAVLKTPTGTISTFIGVLR